MSFFRQHWAKKKAALVQSRVNGEVRVWTVGRRLHVSAPLSSDFRTGAAMLSGTYRERTGTWTFRIQAKPFVMRLLIQTYGKDKIVAGAPLNPLGHKEETTEN